MFTNCNRRKMPGYDSNNKIDKISRTVKSGNDVLVILIIESYFY